MRSRRQYWRVAGAWRRLSWPRRSGCCATVASTSSCARSGCAARAAREQAAAELDRLRQRDAALAADLARLSERRRAIGDEAVRLEADPDQAARSGRAARARSGRRADCPRRRPFRERAPGSGARRTGRAPRRGGLRCEQAATAEAATAQTLEMAETELRQALAVQAELEAGRGSFGSAWSGRPNEARAGRGRAADGARTRRADCKRAARARQPDGRAGRRDGARGGSGGTRRGGWIRTRANVRKPGMSLKRRSLSSASISSDCAQPKKRSGFQASGAIPSWRAATTSNSVSAAERALDRGDRRAR